MLIDTNIWLNIAKDYRMSPVLTAIEDLVTAGTIELIVPQIVLDEFARNRDRVVKDSARGFAAHLKCVREAVTQFGDDEKRSETLSRLDELSHEIAMRGGVSQHTLVTIEKVMATSQAVVASDAVKVKVADRALAKRAPFHLSKNSVADAILIEIFAEAIATATDPETEFLFVTDNTRDFSQHNGDRRLPHADLEPLFQTERHRYVISIVSAIKDIDSDMLAEYEWEHTYLEASRQLSAILDAEHRLFQQVWYNRHCILRSKVENGAVLDTVRAVAARAAKRWRTRSARRTSVRGTTSSGG